VFIPDVGSDSSIIGFVQTFLLGNSMFFAKTGLLDHERVWVIAMINRSLDDSSPNLLICYDPERCSLSARVLCSTRWQIFSSCVQANSREEASGAQSNGCNVKGFDFIHVKT
jgi:hypothetical protein